MTSWLSIPCDYRKDQRQGTSYELFWCEQSRYGQLQPRPSGEEIAAFYEVPEYYTHGVDTLAEAAATTAFADRLLQHLAWRCDFELDADQAALQSLVQRGYASLCDIGCGSGAQLRMALEAGFTQVVGIEPDAAARDAAGSRGISVLAGTAESLPQDILRDRFDVVLMSHVLEHTRDPILALRNIAALLKPSGTAIIEVPNNEARGLRLAGECWPGLDVPRHLNFFTSSSLKEICRIVGLSPRRVEYRGYCRQFSVNWRATEDRIRRAFQMSLGEKRSRVGRSRPWLLLLVTAFARRAKKYDAVRVWADKSADRL